MVTIKKSINDKGENDTTNDATFDHYDDTNSRRKQRVTAKRHD